MRSDSSDRRRAMNVRHNKTLIFTLTVDGDEGKEKRVLKRGEKMNAVWSETTVKLINYSKLRSGNRLFFIFQR